MKGTMIIFFVAVFLLLVLAWLVQETDPGKGYGSKAYHMLLSGFMRLDIALAQAKRYFRLLLTADLAGYRDGRMDAERIRRKQQRLEEFRRENGTGADYKRRARYNRKVLE